MNANGHFQRAKDLEETIAFLMSAPQPEQHVASIVEAIYGAAQHYIAYALQTRHEEHSDTHAGIVRRLRNYGYPETAQIFLEIEGLRMGRWYGKQGDGEAITKCQQLLSRIRDWAIK